MMTTDNVVGVMGLLFEKAEQVITPENQVIMETIARLGAMAIERIKFQ
jgi:K+-sensing histidine kinase KdpD